MPHSRAQYGSFNSLLGILKPVQPGVPGHLYRRFNSLLGILKPNLAKLNIRAYIEFQFLTRYPKTNL